MANTVVFLILSGTAALSAPGAPARGAVGASGAGELGPSELLSLQDFGAKRGLSFTRVAEARPVGLPENDAALVLALEAELEQARTALSALEESRADELLARVEADLLAHPHLPQATFLMAECLALQARALREQAPARALELERRRSVLEGERAPAFGETAIAIAATTPENTAPAPIELTTVAAAPRAINGLSPVDELELDGRPVPPSTKVLALPAGLHQARVFRHGRLIYAQFLELLPSASALDLAAPPLVPCGSEDLQSVAASTPLPPGIACQSWAMVRASSNGGVEVALCVRDHCGNFMHWQRSEPPPFRPITVEHHAWPGWAGFAIAGATLAVASSIVLWQAGAFEHGRPTATRWEYGGLDPQGIRF